MEPSEVISLRDAMVTTPLRTIVDILRFGDVFGDREIRALSVMFEEFGIETGDVAEALDARVNLPARALARARLQRYAITEWSSECRMPTR